MDKAIAGGNLDKDKKEKKHKKEKTADKEEKRIKKEDKLDKDGKKKKKKKKKKKLSSRYGAGIRSHFGSSHFGSSNHVGREGRTAAMQCACAQAAVMDG
mmetsp:Transcript_17755/g.14400  ORF Transcript_17755/g.14400 Transcript_17755/m.14400 type:complete len:99 (+) Transcript_17755:106-402(+)